MTAFQRRESCSGEKLLPRKVSRLSCCSSFRRHLMMSGGEATEARIHGNTIHVLLHLASNGLHTEYILRNASKSMIACHLREHRQKHDAETLRKTRTLHRAYWNKFTRHTINLGTWLHWSPLSRLSRSPVHTLQARIIREG